jgi:ABC-type transport system substrate-binding protein
VNLSKISKKKNSFLNKGKKSFLGFFSFFKKKKEEKETFNIDENLDQDFIDSKGSEDLDKKLVYSLSPKKIPSINQVRHIKKTLNPSERLLLGFLSFIFLGSLIFLGIKFYYKYLEIYPSFGGEYTEGLVGSPKNINPLYASARDVDSDISRIIFSSLFTRDMNGAIKKDLAIEHTVSDDGLEHIIKIRDNVKWHHGEILNSDDIIFTFNAIKNPEYGSPLRTSFLGVEIEKIDDHSLKFILEESYSAFVGLLTFGILPQNVWTGVAPQNAFLNELNVKPIGSGPYKFRSLSKNRLGDIKEMSFVANEDYYKDNPYISKINLKFFNNYRELIEALNSNQVDGISYLSYSFMPDIISQGSLNFHSLSLPQITSVFINQKDNKFLAEVENRKILAKLIDRDKISNDIFFGNAEIAHGPILPSSPSYNDEIKSPEYSYNDATEILSELGWDLLFLDENDIALIEIISQLEEERNKAEKKVQEKTNDEDLEDEEREDEFLIDFDYDKLERKMEMLQSLDDWEAKRAIINKFNRSTDDLIGYWRFKATSNNDKYEFLSIELTTVDLADNIMVADFIKSSWNEAGIRTFINIINPNQVQSDIINQKKFETLLLSQVVGGDQDVYAFWHSSQIGSSGLNITEYRNREVDKLLEEARKAINAEEMIDNYIKFQEILHEDFPVIFLYFPTYTYVQSKKIKGFNFNNILNPADRFNDISSWYIKTKRKIEF